MAWRRRRLAAPAVSACAVSIDPMTVNCFTGGISCVSLSACNYFYVRPHCPSPAVDNITETSRTCCCPPSSNQRCASNHTTQGQREVAGRPPNNLPFSCLNYPRHCFGSTVMEAVLLVACNSVASAVEPTTRTSTGLSKTNVMIRTPSRSQGIRQTVFS